LRILYLTPGCFDKGGISRYCRYQILALREILGEENVRVISLLGPDGEAFEEPFRVDYYAGGGRLVHKAAFTLHAAMATLRHHPGAILSAHINLSGLAQAMAKITGAKSILNVYGVEVWSRFHRDAAWGLQNTDHVISDCRFTAQYIENEGQRSLGTTAVVWDCVDLDKFNPAPPKPEILRKYGIPDPDTSLNLLTLGRMSADTASKGYERLMDVFVRAARQVPALRLIYGGRGDLVEVLRAKARDAKIEDRICFTGMIHEDDLADVYRSAHVFSLVTDRRLGGGEGIPLTPLEAAACGVPILVGNQDGSQEAVIEGINGYILDPFDLEAQARAVVAFAMDEGLRKRMGVAARRRIEEEFAYPLFREKHRRLLQSWFPDAKEIG